MLTRVTWQADPLQRGYVDVPFQVVCRHEVQERRDAEWAICVTRPQALAEYVPDVPEAAVGAEDKHKACGVCILTLSACWPSPPSREIGACKIPTTRRRQSRRRSNGVRRGARYVADHSTRDPMGEESSAKPTSPRQPDSFCVREVCEAAID